MSSISEALRSVGLPESVWEGAATAALAWGTGTAATAPDAILVGAGAMAGSLAARALGFTGVGEYPDGERYLRTAIAGGGAVAAGHFLAVSHTDMLWTAGAGVVGHVVAQTLLYGDIGAGTGAIVF